MGRITLLTDFGTADGYVGAMKGVIASIAPDAVQDDIAHDIPPGDIRAAAWALAGYAFLYPPGTVHLVVVDPGVGTGRWAVAARLRDRFFVLPENGILGGVLADGSPERIVRLESRRHQRQDVSSTFHGRDIFAPAAAHLAAGTAIEELGPPADGILTGGELPPAKLGPAGARGEIVHVDRFGNLISNVPGAWLPGGVVVLEGRPLGPAKRAYGDGAPGEVAPVVGSRGTVEVAVRDGSAAAVLGAGRGARLEVWPA